MPNTTLVVNLPYIELADMLINHGATLITLAGEGPLFPAEAEVTTPFTMAWNDPMAMMSFR